MRGTIPSSILAMSLSRIRPCFRDYLYKTKRWPSGTVGTSFTAGSPRLKWIVSVAEDVTGDLNLRRGNLTDNSVELTRDENLVTDLEVHVGLVVRVEIKDDKDGS